MGSDESLRLSLPLADSAESARPRTRNQRYPEQPRRFDLFGLLGLRRFFRWKYARLVFQLPLLVLVIIMLIDGFTGRQLAPRNMATTATWLHWRGLVVLALALVGNAFCAACPLMLTRGTSRFLRRVMPERLQFRWPRALHNKYTVTFLMVAFFFSYELFDLWASPWLTAWLIVGYFGSALVIDTFFPAGTFCRYVCPLGNFNFVLSHTSPTQVVALDPNVCASCEHKPCLHGRETYFDEADARGDAAFIPLSEITNPNGQGFFPGCETGLFAPTIQSNMDCTNCFNCVRACPYDNVGLGVRSPVREPTSDVWLWRGRFTVMLLAVSLAAWGLLNAAAMVAPFFGFIEQAAAFLNTESEALLFTLLFTLTGLIGFAATTAVGVIADWAGGQRTLQPLRSFMRWGYVVVVLGIGFWFAHYLFHFLTGALQIIPVFQNFLQLQGVQITPDWGLAQLVPTRYLFTITAAVTSLYSLLAIYVSMRIALRDYGRRGVLAMWPVLLFILAFAVFAVWLLGQPMEMRGTLLQPLAD